MGQFVVCLATDKFVVWSNTVDAPTSEVTDADGLVQVLRERRIEDVEARAAVDQAQRTGVSDPDWTVPDVLADNRAGPDEECLSIDEILEQYS